MTAVVSVAEKYADSMRLAFRCTAHVLGEHFVLIAIIIFNGCDALIERYAHVLIEGPQRKNTAATSSHVLLGKPRA